MIRRWIIMLLALLPLAASAQKVIINDPNVAPRTLNESFHSITVSHSIDLFVSQSDQEGLAVSAVKEEYRDKIRTEIKGGVLRIYFENDKMVSFHGNMKLRAYVSFKELKKITASGSSDVIATNTINVPDLTIDMSGSSDFKGTVTVTNLTAKLSGASDAILSGSATNAVINATGASDVRGYDLSADYCTVESSGASDVHITVNKELNARASGSSDISYKGEAPVRNVSTSGSSSVSKKNN
ncbi:DUF2807 domain-containing protein [Pseudoflavitalea sp. G-6-1-2]|uniref:head GIN domain-containing protein n=1 Tax=Pseudoflavitalea sp. G-6-1-2 TaxID=2728841 RepID=UPI00146ED301|nr:head GIN domain-containing protein [Pseudoflavitalea sp. G-6-1-2]NML20999.1 DUF2807 domain-containing protein [Pseudoflavitalea sp. G-6-1-2]